MKKIITATLVFILICVSASAVISQNDNQTLQIQNKNEIPENLIKLYERNPETEDFVFSYPKESTVQHKIDSSKYVYQDEVPLLMQWDKRWGYLNYSGDFAALTGCGPVCLSMVALYLLKDKNMTPDYMIDFAQQNGFSEKGYGTKWTLFSDGAELLGMKSKELPLSESLIIDNLQHGNPVVLVMGPGDFTQTGHFIILTGYSDGKFTVNNPNSIKNSEKLWSYNEISNQIRNIWAISAAYLN